MVDFVLVGGLLLLVVLGIVQLALVLHTRNVLSADAAEGARHAANLGIPESSGGPYAAQLVRRSVPAAGRTVRCSGRPGVGEAGVTLATVTCAGQIRLVLVPLGTSLRMTVTGRAVKETG